MPTIRDTERHYAVERDGLPRVADYDDGSQQVLYLDGDLVRSMPTAEWLTMRGPLPADPTPEQVQAALAARRAAEQQAAQDAAALRQLVRTKAQSAVGVAIDDLLVGQLRALVAILLHKEGALDKDGKIRPLSEWVR